MWKYAKYIENWWILNVSNVLQISPQRKLRSLWNFKLIFIIIFHKDPCTHASTQDINVRSRVLSWWNACAHTYATCARICTWIFTKNHLMVLYYLMNTSLKFHKDMSFRCGDICQTILTFKNHRFSMYFAYFHSFAPPKSTQMDNYWIIMIFFWKLDIKMYISNEQKDTCLSLWVVF